MAVQMALQPQAVQWMQRFVILWRSSLAVQMALQLQAVQWMQRFVILWRSSVAGHHPDAAFVIL